MAFRTEFSLEELLADPMVKLVMCRDRVSMSETRMLYASVRPWPKNSVMPSDRRLASSPAPSRAECSGQACSCL